MKNSEISVVVQGPIFTLNNENNKESSYTFLCCESIRKLLPEAELILSTWEGSSVNGLSFDKLVLNKDPGESPYNINRQICTRKNGILQASRKYVLAIRSESIIKNLDFLSYFKEGLKFGNTHYFKERIVIPAVMPSETDEIFHMGDWYYFGLKEDVLSIWDIPYIKDNEISMSGEILMNSHRYFMLSFIKKYTNKEILKNNKDINKSNKDLYNHIIVDNFIVTGIYNYGIMSLKYPLDYSLKEKSWNLYHSLTYEEWKYMYYKYLDNESSFKLKNSVRFYLLKSYRIVRKYYLKLKKNIRMNMIGVTK